MTAPHVHHGRLNCWGGVASGTSVATLFALISTFKTSEHALPVKSGDTWTYASKSQCFQDGSIPSTYRLKTNDRPLAVGIRELATGRFSFVWIAATLVKAKLFQQTSCCQLKLFLLLTNLVAPTLRTICCYWVLFMWASFSPLCSSILNYNWKNMFNVFHGIRTLDA